MHLRTEREVVVDIVITRSVRSSRWVRPRASGTTRGGTAVACSGLRPERSRKEQCMCGHVWRERFASKPSHERLVAGERTTAQSQSVARKTRTTAGIIVLHLRQKHTRGFIALPSAFTFGCACSLAVPVPLTLGVRKLSVNCLLSSSWKVITQLHLNFWERQRRET